MASPRFQVGFLLYPNLMQLDLTGPAQVLHRMPGTGVHYVWKRVEPVPSDCDLSLLPTVAMAECPPLDLLCVPGGNGCRAVMSDPESLEWLRGQTAGARLVTSVCTGSLILGRAGLLRGYRATCHRAWIDHLARFGAEPVRERVVVDRDRITGAGVTAGIDFAFRVVEALHGREVAEALQLGLEYDPQPLAGGTPATARPEVLASVQAGLRERLRQGGAEIEAIAERFV